MTRHIVLTSDPPAPGAAAMAATLSALLGELADVICGNGPPA
jgi:hypothetical protein